MLQCQWDLIPLCIHALRVGAIVLVVKRHCLSIGERSTSNRPLTATDRAIEPQMRIYSPPTVPIVIFGAFECVRSAAHSQQASSCALNVVKLVCDPGGTMVRGYFGVQATALTATKTNSVVALTTCMLFLLKSWQKICEPTAEVGPRL
jgi:hypothetical protein